MRSLNVRLPTVITRVSEYVPEVCNFIQGIIDAGFAYEANGSVYFDTIKYANAPDHTYAKLEPFSFGDIEKMKEGEGNDAEAFGKKNPQDFVLWKKKKENEPFWESKWG
jgi:cysteinyl-tRNA synthetase